MSTSTFTQPDFVNQGPEEYKTAIDDAANVMKRIGAAFACHESDPITPTMTVVVDGGYIWDGAVLTEVAPQTSATFTAPSGNPRIDRVVIDAITGTISVVAGTESGSPVPPAIPAGKLPVAQVLLDNSPATTAITNSIITDERGVFMAGGNMTVTGTIDNTSDARLKERVMALDGAEASELVMQLRPVSYMKADKPELGFLAQDVKELMPVLVGEAGEYLTLNYIGLIAPLVATIQHQQKEIDALKRALKL